MKASHTAIFDAIKTAGPSRADSIARITALAKLLDSAFLIPGLNRRVGLDAIIGLIPGIGDAVSTVLASYIIWEARQLGLPRWKIAPLTDPTAYGGRAGDAFDLFFQANQRNLRSVHEHLKRGPNQIDGTATRIEER